MPHSSAVARIRPGRCAVLATACGVRRKSGVPRRFFHGDQQGPQLRNPCPGDARLSRSPWASAKQLASQGPCSTTCAIGCGWCASPAAGEHSLLEQLEDAAAEPALEPSLAGPALEQLVEQLPAAKATALSLTVLDSLSLRAAAAQLQISPMAVSHREVRLASPLAQKKALAALRQQLVGAG